MSERGWALVTGAGRRIGRTLALACAGAGYDVVVHGREAPDETIAAIQALGRQAIGPIADLTDATRLEALVAAAPGPVTLLVNCASLFEDDRVETIDVARWDAAMATNLRAPILLSKAFAAALPPGREGLIVNIVDQRVWRLNPQFFSYTISKAALWTATQTLAQALAPRIRVNAIGPGPTLASVHQTPESFAAEAAAIPLARSVDEDDIAAALTYLIGARSVTGQMIAVDGGQHLAWRTPDVAE